jgi:flagellin-like protein
MKITTNKKAISPLVATVLLIVFSLILGTITMNLGKAYISGIGTTETKQISTSQDSTVKYIGNSLYKCTLFDEKTKECTNWELVK